MIGIPIGFTSSAIGLKICAITAGIKKFKSIIKEKKETHDKIVLLAKCKLNTLEVFISMALINSVVSYEIYIFLINNVLKEYNEKKKEIENLKT